MIEGWLRAARPSAAPREAIDRRLTELPGGRTIAWSAAGSGRDCLLIHGTLMTLEDMWLGLAPALAPSGFRVVAVDRPGHGFSRRHRLVDASPWRQAELIHAFAVAEKLVRPVVIGHSFGGTVALAYAALYPDETAGVVALAPVCLPEVRLELMLFGPRAVPGFGDVMAPWISVTGDPFLLPLLWHAIFLPEGMPAGFAASFPFALSAQPDGMVAEGEDAAALLPAVMKLVAGYAAVRAPVHILGGTADIVVNNVLQGAAAAKLMPRARFTPVPGAGHMLHHVAPGVVAEAAEAFR